MKQYQVSVAEISHEQLQAVVDDLKRCGHRIVCWAIYGLGRRVGKISLMAEELDLRNITALVFRHTGNRVTVKVDLE